MLSFECLQNKKKAIIDGTIYLWMLEFRCKRDFPPPHTPFLGGGRGDIFDVEAERGNKLSQGSPRVSKLSSYPTVSRFDIGNRELNSVLSSSVVSWCPCRYVCLSTDES